MPQNRRQAARVPRRASLVGRLPAAIEVNRNLMRLQRLGLAVSCSSQGRSANIVEQRFVYDGLTAVGERPTLPDDPLPVHRAASERMEHHDHAHRIVVDLRGRVRRCAAGPVVFVAATRSFGRRRSCGSISTPIDSNVVQRRGTGDALPQPRSATTSVRVRFSCQEWRSR
jgi:hypothetical protein